MYWVFRRTTFWWKTAYRQIIVTLPVDKSGDVSGTEEVLNPGDMWAYEVVVDDPGALDLSLPQGGLPPGTIVRRGVIIIVMRYRAGARPMRTSRP